MKPLAITGIGTVAPFALDFESFRAGLASPDDARRRAFEGPSTALGDEKLAPQPKDDVGPMRQPTRTAECRTFDANTLLGDKGHRNFDRLTKYLIVAGKRALESAGVKHDGAFVGPLTAEQVGICSSTAYGSLDSITELNLVAELEDPRYINPARFPNTVINAAAGYVSIWEDLRAPNTTVVNGNCGALDAVLVAETHLAHRRANAFLVGGGDVVSEPLYTAFRKLGAVAEGADACEPGSDRSTGIHLGEGAAYVLCERRGDAEARGARVRAVIAGYGTAFEPPTDDAFLLNATPVAIGRAMRLALEDAGVPASAVSVVCSSASGLPRYDVAELHAIERLFGTDVAVVAPKSLFGEAFAGSAALGLAAAVAWVEGTAPAPLIAGIAPPRVDVVVVTAVGYYGNASAVVVKRS